jgi:hypothetical protein
VRCGAFLVASILAFLAGCTAGTDNEAQSYMPVTHDPGCLSTANLNYCFAVEPAALPVGNMPVRNVTWQQWGAERAVGQGELLTRECIPSCVEGRSWYRNVTVTVSDPITCEGVRTYSRMRVDRELEFALPLRC